MTLFHRSDQQLPDELQGDWRHPELGLFTALRLTRAGRVLLRRAHDGRYEFSYATREQLLNPPWTRVGA